MKLKVLKQFHDKNTNELYQIGTVIDVTDERGQEILDCKYNVAEIVVEESDDKPKKRGKKSE